jgi:alkylation response protein AidB-like acyl-CoA dehydrogenase
MLRTLFEAEHDMFRESVQEFCRRHVAPHLARWRTERAIDRRVWLEAGSKDFLGLAMPQDLGGTDLSDFRFNQILGEELSAAAVAVGSAFGIHVDVVAPYLLELTTAEQRERWIPGFCDGSMVTALAMTEPGAGSDLAAIRTRARPDGDGWVLDGAKTFITNGIGADLVIVAARTGDGRKDVSLFAVEGDATGFSRGRKLDKIGQHEADTGELFFDRVRIPAENLLGAVDEGFTYMLARLPQERLSVAVANVAHAAGVLAETIAYVKGRHAFGQSIGSFQHSRFLIAELDTEVDVARAFVDRCVEAHVAGRLTPVDAAKAKWWSADVQNRVIDACVQLHGGYGYMDEYPVARAWADARVTRIWAGSDEIMKELIGRSLGFGEEQT